MTEQTNTTRTNIRTVIALMANTSTAADALTMDAVQVCVVRPTRSHTDRRIPANTSVALKHATRTRMVSDTDMVDIIEVPRLHSVDAEDRPVEWGMVQAEALDSEMVDRASPEVGSMPGRGFRSCEMLIHFTTPDRSPSHSLPSIIRRT